MQRRCILKSLAALPLAIIGLQRGHVDSLALARLRQHAAPADDGQRQCGQTLQYAASLHCLLLGAGPQTVRVPLRFSIPGLVARESVNLTPERAAARPSARSAPSTPG